MDQITFSQKLDFPKYFRFTLKYAYTRPFMLVFQALWGLALLFLLLGLLVSGGMSL